MVLVGLVASTGCQSVAEPATTEQIGTTATTTSASDYPSLYTVPPRPHLTYNVQQRRAIVDGLIADRANARYTDQVIRYRTGRSTLPPPPAPPPVVASVEPTAPAEPTKPGKAAAPPPQMPETTGGRAYPGASGDETLGDFVDQLVNDTAQQPSTGAGAADEGAKSGGSGFFGWLRGLFGQADEPAAPTSPTAVPPPDGSLNGGSPAEVDPPQATETALAALVAKTGPASEPAAGPEPTARLQQAMAPSRRQRPVTADGSAAVRPDPDSVGIAIGGGGVAIEIGPPALKPAPVAVSASTSTAAMADVRTTSASGSSSAETPAARIAFAPGSAKLPAGAGRELEQVLATARAESALIRIVGEADAAALALDRARAVAIELVRLGARASDLDMGLGAHATGDQVQLLLAPAGRAAGRPR
jgi:hypothetical protein